MFQLLWATIGAGVFATRRVAPLIRLPVLQPEYRGGRVGLDVLAIRNNQFLAVVLEDFDRISLVSDRAHIKAAFNAVVGNFLRNFYGPTKPVMFNTPPLYGSNADAEEIS